MHAFSSTVTQSLGPALLDLPSSLATQSLLLSSGTHSSVLRSSNKTITYTSTQHCELSCDQGSPQNCFSPAAALQLPSLASHHH